MPLHLRKSLPILPINLHPAVTRALTAILLVVGLSGGLNQGAKATQDGQTTPAINFRERPKYVTDPQRMRRTAQIDGVLSDNEYDPFYTVTDGPIKGTVYCNWDDNYLYIAARTDGPATLIFDVDASNDGWLRSADNLEIVIGSVGEGGGITRAVRLLDAANSKESPAWNDKVIDPASLLVAGKVVNGSQFVEIAIPKSTGSLVLRSGVNIGLRVEFLPPIAATAYVPTQPFEPHLLLEGRLVDSRIQSVPGINPRLTISDDKCIASQNLFATLELLNQTDQPIPIKSVTWTGQGSSANAVNTVREVTVPPLPGLKTLRLKYKTVLPPDLTPGSYSLTVLVEMEGGKQIQSSRTFTVVEPIQAQMSAEPEPVAIVGQTKLMAVIDVFSAVPRGTTYDIELTTVPQGWEVDGGRKRKTSVDREDGHKKTRFTLKLPSTTPAGDYPLEATVTWRGRVWKLKHIAQVVRTDAPKLSAPPETKPGTVPPK